MRRRFLTFVLWGPFALLLCSSTCELSRAQTNVVGCTCDFADPKWQAYGTKAACASFMHNGRTSCEIEFAGISASPNLVNAVLGANPAAYRQDTFAVLNLYLQYLRDGKRDDLVDPEFLTKALQMLMRGAYLRGPLSDEAIQQRKLLDGTIALFLSKYSKDVSDVFIGRKGPFSTEVDNARFQVGKGFIVVDRLGDRLTAVYFPPE